MSLSGAFGSAAGYTNLIVKIAIFVASISSMIDMLYLRNSTYHALLFSTRFIFMMTLMLYSFDKHIYDIIQFLLASFLWIKSNMILPKFLTQKKWEYYNDKREIDSNTEKTPILHGLLYARRSKNTGWLYSTICHLTCSEKVFPHSTSTSRDKMIHVKVNLQRRKHLQITRQEIILKEVILKKLQHLNPWTKNLPYSVYF